MCSDDLIVSRLACIIDNDAPPGLAATQLARRIISLIQGRDGVECVALASEIASLGFKYPRIKAQVTHA